MNTFNLPIGTVILTNSNIPENNGKWGAKWNHCAIVVSFLNLVHSNYGEGTAVDSIESLIKHPETGEYMFLYPKDRYLGGVAADTAYGLAGTKYNWMATLTRWTLKSSKWNGINCVGVVRKAFESATGRNLRWRFPDNILKSNLFIHSEIYNNV